MELSRREVLASGLALAASRAAADPADTFAGLVYPDDAFSRPRVDRLPVFATLSGVAPEFDVRTRLAHFAEDSLQLTGRGRTLRTRWRFTTRDRDMALLVIDERIRRAPESVSVRVRNRSSRPVRLGIDLHELAWLPTAENVAHPHTLGTADPLAPGEERVLAFPFAAAATQTPAPRPPFVAIVLIARNISAGAPYDLELSDLTVRYPDAPGVRVTRLDVQPSFDAGESVCFFVAAAGRLQHTPVDLDVRRGERVLWRIRLTDAEIAELRTGVVAIDRVAPWWLPPGEATVGLAAGGYRAAGAVARSRVRNRRTPRLARGERRTHGGRPTFFLDGKPFPWQGYASYDYQPGNVGEFGAHGATVFCVPTCAGRHVHAGVASPTWVEPGRFDFGQLDERVCFSLQANPRAAIFLRVSLALPAFWTQSHEADLARAATDAEPIVWSEGNAYPAPSLASEAWRRDQERALVALIRHVLRQPWAERVAGFWLTCEVTEEWFAWGCNDGFLTDYSEPMERRFAAAAGLPVPPEKARHAPGRDLLPDSPDGRAAAAYHRFQSELSAETISHFARVVKRETHGRSLAGAFYGYVIQLTGEPRQAFAGQFALRRLIDDPNVDFIGGIPLHDFRDLTNGYNPYTSATDSIERAGKLFCNENDLFSWLHPLIWHRDYDPKDPRGGAISMHRRECAGDAVRGAVSQKFSLETSWHHDAALQADFARQSAINAECLALDRTPVEEIAFVVDDTSLAWTSPESALPGLCSKRLMYRLGRTGAPVGVWLLSDIDRLPGRIRLVVVAHAPAPLPADLDRLRRAIKRGGRTIVVVGAPGLIDPVSGKRQPDAPASVLGLPIRVDEAGGPGPMTTTDGTVMADIATSRPRATADGAGPMRYADGPTACCERPLADGGRLVWCGAPPLSTALLRQWVERAGVHCYAPPEFFVHAARGLVAVTSPSAGEFPLTWPGAVEARDLFDGWSVRGATITVPFAAGQTRLFRVRRL